MLPIISGTAPISVRSSAASMAAASATSALLRAINATPPSRSKNSIAAGSAR